MTSAQTKTGWWGRYDSAEGEVLGWRIGPLGLWCRRREREWKFAYRWSPSGGSGWKRLPDDAEPPTDGLETERHLFRQAPETLVLRPALADRPIVTSPRMPIFLAPEEETTLYVGSPLWVAIGAGDSHAALRELPVRRPSDSWFGPSTLEGDLCYAIRTQAVLDRAGLGAAYKRALTPLRLRNLADEPFELERLKLPVPYLELFGSPDGELWTQGLTMTRQEASGLAEVEVRPGAPAEAPEAEPLCPPREAHEGRSLMHVFSSLFGN